ncbi:TRAP transporter small permease [Microbacterium sp. W1N]|uniref:TRAP transporter small permease n=1 Tax=Microbacterium festucae TaxID=2977531 RepID=UPI0021C186DA|nr:TRAP transporter small permease [Microbacterium festucae]MCT9819848.1 TRAP transporter small permease [Microbacterium festucae]
MPVSAEMRAVSHSARLDFAVPVLETRVPGVAPAWAQRRWTDKEIGNAARHVDGDVMTDGPREFDQPEDPAPSHPDAKSAAVPPEIENSIFPATKTFFTTPKLNEGVPADPGFIRVLSAIEITVAVTLFAFIIIGVMYQVLGRYFPAVSWVGAGELALLSMIALTFTTAGYLVGRNGHIVLEIFDEMLAGTRWFAALRIVSAVIMVLTCVALAYEAWVKVDAEWGRLSAAMHVPMGVLYIFALVGFLSAAVHSAFKIPYAGRPERKLDIGEMDI